MPKGKLAAGAPGEPPEASGGDPPEVENDIKETPSI